MKRKASSSPAPNRPPLKRQNAMTGQALVSYTKRSPKSGLLFSATSGGKEKKYIDVNLGGEEFSTTGSITFINPVNTSSDFTNCIGRSYVVTSVQIKGNIAVGATPTASTVRYLVVYDKNTNGATPAITDILTAANADGLVNMNNRDRFVIVADVMEYVEAAGKSNIPVDLYRKCSLQVDKLTSASTVAAIGSGGFFFVTVGVLATGATAPTMVNGTSRCRFYDN